METKNGVGRCSVAKALASAALLGLLAAGTGCEGNGGGMSFNGGKKVDNRTPAERCWDKLRDDARGGEFIGGIIGMRDREAGQFVADTLRRAEEKAKDAFQGALQSDLPINAVEAMADDMAQVLIRRLPNEPMVRDSQTAVVLAFADLIDQTDSRNAGLQRVMDSLRNKLVRNEAISNNFVFVSTTEADASKLSSLIAGKDTSMFRDPLQRRADGTKPVVYDPNVIFVIKGKLYSDRDIVNHTMTLTMAVNFEHVQSRQSIVSEEFRKRYMWNPCANNERGAWELQP